MDNSTSASVALGQVLYRRRRKITVLEFTSKYDAEFPDTESQEAVKAFTSMLCIGAIYWVDQDVFECIRKEEFTSKSLDFKKYMNCADSAKICSWLESLL
jgi:hypothetical protein